MRHFVVLARLRNLQLARYFVNPDNTATNANEACNQQTCMATVIACNISFIASFILLVIGLYLWSDLRGDSRRSQSVLGERDP